MLLSAIVIAVLFILLVVLAGVVFIGDRRKKKNGCVGCPYKKQCGKKDYDEDVGDDNEFLDF